PGLRLSERQPNIVNWADDTEKAKTADARPDPLDPTEVGGTVVSTGVQLSAGQWVIRLFDDPTDTEKPMLQHGWALLPVIMSSGGVREESFGDSFGILMSPPGNVPAVDPFHWALGAPDDTVPRNHAVIHNHSARR
ncbi:MAG: hypothetical protein FWD31_12225, partial [Planctomycetaceae bacterium]|nr:hypothetical protein [Planctomycetaceae bacterium]